MKIRTKEEEQRYQEEQDAEPYMPGFTWGEYRRLPERRQQRENQKIMQRPASSLGYWKTCTLPSCRRAKACRGFLSEIQSTTPGYHKFFPPCIRDGADRQAATLKELGRLWGVPEDDRNT